MGKEEIKKLLGDSKRVIEQDHADFSKSIKSDLASFKKKALG